MKSHIFKVFGQGTCCFLPQKYKVNGTLLTGQPIIVFTRPVRAEREENRGDSVPDSVQCVVCLGAEREV